jgi:hypothetical protein
MADANQGVAPPDLTTDVGKVRLLVGDTDPSNVTSGVGTYFWFSDDELQGLVDLNGSVKAASIYVLRMVAMTPAMQLRKWQSADLMVDGPAITTALRALIKDIEAGVGAAAEAEALDIFQVVDPAPIYSPLDIYGGRRPRSPWPPKYDELEPVPGDPGYFLP